MIGEFSIEGLGGWGFEIRNQEFVKPKTRVPKTNLGHTANLRKPVGKKMDA